MSTYEYNQSQIASSKKKKKKTKSIKNSNNITSYCESQDMAYQHTGKQTN